MTAKIETKPFDSADYLGSAEAVVGYLDAHLEDSSLKGLRQALATVARSRGIFGPGAAQRDQPAGDLSQANAA